MSLKAIEMQVAIPRTQTAGKIQDQLQQRGQVVQDHLAAEQVKEELKNRKQVVETSESDQKRLNNDAQGQNNHNSGKQSKKEKSDIEEVKYAKHPYKGNFVDFSG